MIFSREFDTLEAAQASAPYSLFDGACVFLTPDGQYVTANARLEQWTSEEIRNIADGVARISGYRMVAVRDALFNVWHRIETGAA